jgi:hypothetical protein
LEGSMDFAVALVAGAGPDHERLAKFRGKPRSAGLTTRRGGLESLVHTKVQQADFFWIFLCRGARNFAAQMGLRESPYTVCASRAQRAA